MISNHRPTRAATILIVEDDPVQQMIFAAVAARTGMPVRVAAEADEAIAVLQEIGHDGIGVIVLDVDLGASTGWDVLAAARHHGDRSTLPVILLTGHDEVEERIHGLQAGATDYMGKPAHPRELQARIEAHLRTSTSWRGVLDADLRRRATLADAIAEAAAGGGDRAREAVIQALVAVDGVAAADVIALDGHQQVGVDTGPLRASRIRLHRRGEVLRRLEGGPCLVRSDEAICAWVPFTAGSRQAMTMLELDPCGSLDAQALLALAIDATAMLAPAIGERLLDVEASAQLRDTIDDTIRSQRFRPVFQSVVALGTGRVVGFEGLTRFEDRRPDLMFADAALVGRSRELHRATTQRLASAAARLPRDCYLALNVSAEVLSDPALPSWLPSDRDVVLEVTEHEPVDDYERLLRVVEDLGPRVRLAVDDAGAGHATFHHVLRLRPDIVKLDRSLIAGIHRSPDQEALVAGLVHFADRIDVRLIAEGVELAEESALLARLGVPYVQGYLYGRPGPAEDLALCGGGVRA